MDIFAYKGIGSEPSDKVRFVNSAFLRAIDATSARRARMYENLQYFYSDQIPDPIRRKMKEKDKLPIVYNIAQRKITGLVGALLRNNFNITYLSLDGKQTSVIHALQDMLSADQNSGNWDWNLMQFIKYGLIEESCMELTTNMRESPLGNLAFECCQPGSVIIDPNWRTESTRDITEAFKYTYLLPNQIMEMWPDMAEEIKGNLLSRMTPDYNIYDNRETPSFNQDYAFTVGGQYMVLQYYYIRKEDAQIEIDMSTLTELPNTQDTEYKKRWCQLKGVNLDTVRVIQKPKNICQVLTVLPGLLTTQPLEDRPHELQIERLPFFPWSSERINGDTHSILDIIRPLQDAMNRRENQTNAILEYSAMGGCAIDPAIVGNDAERMKAIQANWSDPAMKFFTAPGVLAGGKTFFAQLPKDPPPTEMLNQINHLWDAVDRVIPINAAADGRSESASESGILYQYKEAAIEVAQTTLVRSLMGVLTEMGDGYMRAAKNYYSDVERRFTQPDGKQFTINEVIPLPSGDVGIVNDISSLQNLRTLVKMGPDSPNARFSKRVLSIDLLKQIPQTMPRLIAEMIGQIVNTMDLDDDDQKAIEAAVQAEIQAATALEAANAANSANTAATQSLNALNAEHQLQQAQQPPAPQQAANPMPMANANQAAAAQKPNPLAALMAKPQSTGASPTGRFAMAKANPLGPLINR